MTKASRDGPPLVLSESLRLGEDVFDGAEEEGEFVVAVGEAVFLHGPCAPAVNTAESHLRLVDEQVGERCFLHFR